MSDISRRVPMKRLDTQPALQVQILNRDGSPRDVTLDAIVFNMGNPGVPRKINGGTVTKISPGLGIVEYRWQTNDCDTNGDYRAEFDLNGNDTYPKDGYILVEITERV